MRIYKDSHIETKSIKNHITDFGQHEILGCCALNQMIEMTTDTFLHKAPTKLGGLCLAGSDSADPGFAHLTMCSTSISRFLNFSLATLPAPE